MYVPAAPCRWIYRGLKVELIQALIDTGQASNIREAKQLIKELRKAVMDGEYGGDPEEALLCEFGLEPDYVFDLMGW
jgi:hypothetical protein